MRGDYCSLETSGGCLHGYGFIDERKLAESKDRKEVHKKRKIWTLVGFSPWHNVGTSKPYRLNTYLGDNVNGMTEEGKEHDWERCTPVHIEQDRYSIAKR